MSNAIIKVLLLDTIFSAVVCLIDWTSSSWNLFTLILTKISFHNQPSYELAKPLSSRTWLELVQVSNFRTFWFARAPSTGGEASPCPAKQILINLIQGSIILFEFPSKSSITRNHLVCVIKGKDVRVLFRGIVPWNIMQIMIDNSLSKLWNIAYDSLKVAFRWGDKVCVVHEKSSW